MSTWTLVMNRLLIVCVYLIPLYPMPPSSKALQQTYPWSLEVEDDHGTLKEMAIYQDQKQAEHLAEVWRRICNDVEFRVIEHRR